MINMGVRFGFLFSKPSSLETFVCNLLQLKNVLLANVFQNLHCAQPHVICTQYGPNVHYAHGQCEIPTYDNFMRGQLCNTCIADFKTTMCSTQIVHDSRLGFQIIPYVHDPMCKCPSCSFNILFHLSMSCSIRVHSKIMHMMWYVIKLSM